MVERRKDNDPDDARREPDVDDKVFPSYQAGVGLPLPPQAVGIDPAAEADAVNRGRKSEPTEEDEWHMPDEDRDKAVENARRRESD